MTPEFSPRRRLLLFGVLPVSLLMIAVPVFPHLEPQIEGVLRDVKNQQVASASLPPTISEPLVYDENSPRISPSIEPGLRKGRRMMALDVIRRLEEEARRKGGNTRLTPLDLKRLRNALRESESSVVKNPEN